MLSAIHRLRNPGYLGIHAVWSGFNQAFHDYYKKDPISEVNKLAKKNIVLVRPVKGGVMLYDYKEYKKSGRAITPKSRRDSSGVLRKILEE